ncbi:efflux RND transporter periplasmic adaptor subunit [uncultured Thiodictyon sp.]|uniref:HlyD family secretion protein n=1 Tax=uncultured Thiodictyon sp. TaxID=1846217 RepID=UPI0025F83FBF|nr:efflux RND transporter periplasmic adaptor subunit [uncultured Thiodictyon sp.]
MHRPPPSMSLTLRLFVVGMLLGAAVLTQAADTSDLPSPAPRSQIAALGRVEPISEEIRIAAAMTGRLADVMLDEGDPVHQGQVVATLENADHLARVQAAEASVGIARAALDRVINGARPSERDEAAAAVSEAQAVLARAERELARQQGLAEKRLGSGQDLDNARSALDVAHAQLARLRAHLAVVDSPARADEQAKAQAELALAQAQLAVARAIYEKSFIRSPIDGVVLRRFRRAGEQVTEMGDTPIMAVGDIAHLRVRAEVDEADIALLRLGQDASIQADAYGERRIPGKVGRIGNLMGRKQITSDDPAERKDSRVLEVLIDLAPGVSIPIGLRVNVYIAIPAPAGESQ